MAINYKNPPPRMSQEQKDLFEAQDTFIQHFRLFIVPELEKNILGKNWEAIFREGLVNKEKQNDKKKQNNWKNGVERRGVTEIIDLIDFQYLGVFAVNRKDFFEPIFGKDSDELPKWFNKIYSTRNPNVHGNFKILSHDKIEDCWAFMKQIAGYIGDSLLLERLKAIKDKTHFPENEVRTIENFARLFRFSDASPYGKMNELYVPPKEYNEIIEILERERIVFITGPPEYGKTFTAYKLLWEWFVKGYTPHWEEGNESLQRINVRRELLSMYGKVKSKNIYYFEDPFGKNIYERNESLERNFNSIIQSVQNIEDAYFIITSREEILREFKRSSINYNAQKPFEKQIDLIEPSYSLTQRKQMVLLYAKYKKCYWLENEVLKNFVLTKIENLKNLPSPLSIFHFAEYSFHDRSKPDLEINLKKASEETAQMFAKEILEMSEAEMLFISVVFVSQELNIYEIQNIYDDLIKYFKLRGQPQEFERIIKKFDNTRILIRWKVEFSHPAYFEALKYLFENSLFLEFYSQCIRQFVLQNQILFSLETIAKNYNSLPGDLKKLLLGFLEKEEWREYSFKIFLIIIKNYRQLPAEVLTLLYKLPYNGIDFWRRRYSFENDFFIDVFRYNVPINVKEELCAIFAELEITYIEFARGLLGYYPKLTPKMVIILISVLKKIIEWDSPRDKINVAHLILRNYNHLPDEIKRLFFSLVSMDRIDDALACTIIENYNILPERIKCLVLNIDVSKSSTHLISSMALKYNEFPEDLKELLYNVLRKNLSLGYNASVICANYEKLPEKIRDILFSMAEIASSRQWTIMAITQYYAKMSDKIRAFLFKLAESKFNQEWIIRAVAQCYAEAHHEVRELAHRIIKEDFSTPFAIGLIFENYGRLPKELQQKAFKIARDRSTCFKAIEWLTMLYYSFPQDLRSLLVELSQQEFAAKHVAYNIAKNYERLPPRITGLLDQPILNKKLQECILAILLKDKKEALEIFHKTQNKFESPFIKEFKLKVSIIT